MTCTLCIKIESLPAADLVWQFPRSVAFLGPWQYYHGYCVLVARRHVRELFEMEVGERRAYLDELCLLAQAIHDCFAPRKINYELLGNQVPHLHGHVFPRYHEDPDHLKPVWLALEHAEHDPAQRQRLETGPLDRAATIARLQMRLKELKAPEEPRT